MAKAKEIDWLAITPDCIAGDICDARDVAEAVNLAEIQLDLIAEGQDGTEDYSAADVKKIKAWIQKAKRLIS